MNLQPTVYLVDPDGPTREDIEKQTNLMGFRCKPFASGHEFLAAFDPAEAGCIVLELRVPGFNGLQIQQRLRDSGATMPVVFISTGPSVSIAVHAMRAGALHFLEKPIRENDLWAAIQEAVQVDHRRRQVKLKQDEVDERLRGLTEKEQAVLEMMGAGLAKQVIASELGVSVRTIEHHRTQLMRKLNTNSLAGLLQLALSKTNEPSAGNGRPNHDHDHLMRSSL
jgi:two-component system response regulator FixJ